MKTHRTDGLSLTFGLLFVTIVACWLVDKLVDLSLPHLGWFVAAALILLGVLGLIGALRMNRDPAPPAEVPLPPPVVNAGAAPSTWDYGPTGTGLGDSHIGTGLSDSHTATDLSDRPTGTDLSEDPIGTDLGDDPTRTDLDEDPTRTDLGDDPTEAELPAAKDDEGRGRV